MSTKLGSFLQHEKHNARSETPDMMHEMRQKCDGEAAQHGSIIMQPLGNYWARKMLKSLANKKGPLRRGPQNHLVF